MPISPLLGSVIGSGVSSALDIGGSLIGGAINHNRNQKAWREANDYNSPRAQMDRLKAAGLNPNLVYGNGSAVNTAPTQKTSDTNLDSIGSKGLSNYVAMANQRASNDLIEKQKEFINAQIADKYSSLNYRDMAQTEKTIADKNYILQSLEQKKQLTDAFQDTNKLDNELKRKQIGLTQNNADLVKLNIKNYPIELQNKILETRARISNLNMNTEKQQVEKEMLILARELRKNGVEVNDNVLFRMFSDVIGAGKGIFKDMINMIFE